MIARSAFVALTLSVLATQTYSDPLSAVDWLSESLEQPQTVAPEKPLEGISIEGIETTTLTNIQKDTVGLFPSQISGIPIDFWGTSNVERLAVIIRNAPKGQIPAITALWRRIVLAEINPPVVGTSSHSLLAARLDNLLMAGDLDPAEALLKAANPQDSELFRRWFDVSILTQRTDDACKRMANNPNFAPTLQARIFCLARLGDWKAAELTLSTSQAIGSISDQEALLAGMFLDPEAFESDAAPELPEKLTPLTFVMRESLALPRPAHSLPLAFLHLDLQNNAGWKVRITSAERLVRENALPTTALLNLYLEGSPSASGSVWDRVAAVQKLNDAFASGDDDKLSDTLVEAYNQLKNINLEFLLADWFAPALLDHDLTSAAQEIAFKLAVLHPDATALAPKFASSAQDDQFIISILSDDFTTPAKTDMQSAISNALQGFSQKSALHLAIEDNRKGEAIISALTLLHDGPETDVGDIETALSVMAYDGFKEEAKRIAIQLLVLGKNT
ncbi:hypothetical protein F9L33_02315 [Amylibacter sp. SFDW26]|uniref:hypothetical protein n=1 Tax=Amylibacter sp. SFDW26 TaxID=2652722 RepID=UPI00132702E3|nr:hypothetical protein [Amylibacter sp. SFDW26]KAB7615615.1 hypothetical protein F9L33_02315 [Amylibacter sp. SFDW26]